MLITRGVLAILALVAIVFLGAAPALADDRDRLVQVGLQGKVVQLVADADGTCALTEAGKVYCWSADYPRAAPAGRDPLLLVTIGALLVAAGTTLLMLSRRRTD
jgi:hypothetical protein